MKSERKKVEKLSNHSEVSLCWLSIWPRLCDNEIILKNLFYRLISNLAFDKKMSPAVARFPIISRECAVFAIKKNKVKCEIVPLKSFFGTFTAKVHKKILKCSDVYKTGMIFDNFIFWYRSRLALDCLKKAVAYEDMIESSASHSRL